MVCRERQSQFIILFIFFWGGLFAANKDFLPARNHNNLLLANYYLETEKSGENNSSFPIKIISQFDVIGFSGFERIANYHKIVGNLRSTTGQEWGHLYSHIWKNGEDSLAKYCVFWRKDRVTLKDIMPNGLVDGEVSYLNDPICLKFSRKDRNFVLLLSSLDKSNHSNQNLEINNFNIFKSIDWVKAFWNERNIFLGVTLLTNDSTQLLDSWCSQYNFINICDWKIKQTTKATLEKRLYFSTGLSKEKNFAFVTKGIVPLHPSAMTIRDSKSKEKKSHEKFLFPPLWVEMKLVD